MPAASSLDHGEPVCTTWPSTLISASVGSKSNFTVPNVGAGGATVGGGAGATPCFAGSSLLPPSVSATTVAVPPARIRPTTTNTQVRLFGATTTGGTYMFELTGPRGTFVGGRLVLPGGRLTFCGGML